MLNIDETSLVRSSADLSESQVSLRNGALLVIEEGVRLYQVSIYIDGGVLRIGAESQIGTRNEIRLHIEKGSIEIADHCVVNASELFCRFGGKLSIGSYTSINERTEIRCENYIEIGEYGMISYDCLIFDSNTHQILPIEARRERTRRRFPAIGLELKRSRSEPVRIGSDVWIGQRATILKGAHIGDGSVVGASTVVTKAFPDYSVLVGNPAVARSRREDV
jgi:acetyltransferase-like isoleucine patch superfamily enzyme